MTIARREGRARLTQSAAVLMLLLCLVTAGCDSHSNDEKFLAHFAEHRAGLEQIVGLFAGTTALSRVMLDPADDGSGSPLSQQVRTLMVQLGLTSVARDHESGGIRFATRDVGLGVPNTSEGLLYAERLPPGYSAKLVDDIDLAFAAARLHQKSHGSLDLSLVRPIEGPWYLFLETR